MTLQEIKDTIYSVTLVTLTVRQESLALQSYQINTNWPFEDGDVKLLYAHAYWVLHYDSSTETFDTLGITGEILERQTDRDRIKMAERKGPNSTGLAGTIWADLFNGLFTQLDGIRYYNETIDGY